ncbi:unnamed protein product [Closterium sp. Naga37s-1]|nr:unnamed protein product [Closterium sp. Naga37s-1]
MLLRIVSGKEASSILGPADTPQMQGQASVEAASRNHEVLQAFRVLDVNGDGKISPQELRQVLDRMGWADESAMQELMAKADTNGDGLIDFEEFVHSSLNHAGAGARDGGAGGIVEEEAEEGEEDLRKAFELFDCDGDGSITAEELQKAMRMLSGDKLSMEECRTMIARVDVNRDGRVSFSEFKGMMDGVLR